MTDRYPGYDVLTKRNSVSWNDQTRAVIDGRVATDPQFHQFCDEAEWSTLVAVCDQVVPQRADQLRKVPIAALIDQKLHAGKGNGYRDARLPEQDDAWRRGLAAIDAEAILKTEKLFRDLDKEQQRLVLETIQRGDVASPAWHDIPAALFFKKRLLPDVVAAYYSHPFSWNEIGFGGPASPRGYVRMNFDRRDPWEAMEAAPGREEEARRENQHVG